MAIATSKIAASSRPLPPIEAEPLSRDLFAGGGELGALMRSTDWSATSLGPVESWPQDLRTCIRIILTSRQPMFVWWGRDLINLYNDAYRSILGGKHPAALGQPAHIVWREIWDQVGPRAETALHSNEGTYDESLLLIMERYGYPEETYYTFSYSAVPGDGDGGGILCANTDDTQRILSERQLALLGEMATRTADARTWKEACRLSALGLSTNPKDICFALIYAIENGKAVLAGATTEIHPGDPFAPEVISLDNASVWPIGEALRSHDIHLTSDLETKSWRLPQGAWGRPPHTAAIVPVAPSGSAGRAGVLIIGLNPYRRVDEGYCNFLKLVAGQVSAGIASAEAFDIANSFRSMEEAAKTHNMLAAIVEWSDDAIISKDLNGNITSWNASAERIFGYSAKEIIGKPITTIIPPHLHSNEERILSIIRRGEHIHHFETVRLTKSGELIDVSLTISPIKDAAGNIIGAAKIARDITQKKKAEETLRVSERLASVGRLAATVAHEINNPLEATTNLLYLARQTSGKDEVQMYLSRAEEEVARVSQMARQTLGFYRASTNPVPMRISSVIDSLSAIFSSRAHNKGIELQTEIRQDPEVIAVPGEIRQLLINLVGNSIDAIHDSGVVRMRVSAARHQPGVFITIADSGSGIPPEIRSKIFEPFFTTKEEIGTGLGLWITKDIVEKHGGTIRLKSSTTPGQSWTVFSIFLPTSNTSHTLPS